MLEMKLEYKALRGSKVNLKKQHVELLNKWSVGIFGGISDHLNHALAIAEKEYFVNTYREKVGGNGTRAYVPFNGANKKSRDKIKTNPKTGKQYTVKGKDLFVKGKIVNRSGLMQKAFAPVRWSDFEGSKTTGLNGSPDLSCEIGKKSGGFYGSIRFTGRTAKLMGIHINKSKIRIMELAFRKAKRNFDKLVKAKIVKALKPIGVLR
jgi:hypothetical protein